MTDTVAPAAPSETPAEPAAATPAAAPEVRKFKIPFPDLGEVELPESDVVGLVTQFAKLRTDEVGARKKMAELEEMLADDGKLEELLRARGKDPAKLGEEWLKKTITRQVEEAKLTPEQKEIKELKDWKAAQEAAKKSEQEKADAASKEALVQAEFQKIEATAAAALKQTSIPEELHNHPDVKRRLGALMKRNHELGSEVSPFILAKQLESALMKEHDYVFSQFKPETLYKRLGRKGVEALIKMYAAEMQGPPPEEAAPKKKALAAVPEDPNELRWKARELQRERIREEQRYTMGASIRPSRYFGK